MRYFKSTRTGVVASEHDWLSGFVLVQDTTGAGLDPEDYLQRQVAKGVLVEVSEAEVNHERN